MKLHLLGVNGPFPESGGATSGYLVSCQDTLLQMDLGAGVLSRLTALTPPELLDALLLTHWHFDHTSDLLPLIYRLQAMGKTLDLYAPEDSSSAMLKIALDSGCFRFRPVAAGDAFTVGCVQVAAVPARHPVPTVGYRLEGEGRKIGYTGDTNTLPGLAESYAGCSLLLADGLFPESVWTEEKPHLSAALAARLAREAGAGQLVITHLNPLYDPALLLREARKEFPAALLASAGSVL